MNVKISLFPSVLFENIYIYLLHADSKIFMLFPFLQLIPYFIINPFLLRCLDKQILFLQIIFK